MNKKIFTALILLMGISMLGIITVQLIWMNNAIKVQNDLFDRGVNEALQQTINRLENMHNFEVVNEMFFDDSVNWVDENVHVFEHEHDVNVHVLPDGAVVRKKEFKAKAPKPVQIIREFGPGKNNAIVEIKVDSDSSKNSFSYRVQTKTNVEAEQVFISKNGIEPDGIIVLKHDTIVTDADSLYSLSMVKIDSVLTKLDTIAFVKPDISKRAKSKAVRLKRIANQALNEIYTWDVQQLDEKLIQKVLSEELVNKNIPIPFEYGILRDSIMEFQDEVKDSVEVANSQFLVNLYPNDVFQKNIKLAVFFPNRDSFVYRSLNWLMMASLLFSLFILGSFALSIYYILRQKKISEMKSDFINNMTHEFKTPIATISVAADSITNEKVVGNPDKIKYFAGMIKKENIRMNQQVEDILTIARLDKKDFEFTWEAVDVHELIKDAIQGISIQVERREGNIDARLNAANPMITTDRMHCTNVIFNLLDNAIKYSSGSPEIKVVATNQANGVLISVEDKGIGMSKAVQSKIFERFYRQTSGNIHNVKGFGLGLSYVKAVLEANKGSISVSSEAGNGSKFSVFLPFVRD